MTGFWRILGRIAGAVLALLFVAILVWFGGVGPWGPIAGGVLWGETVTTPPDGWSFVDRVAEVQVETHLGPLPWSVTTWCFSHQGRLYISSRNCLSKRWVKNVLRNPNVRVRIDGRIYQLRAVRDEDPTVGEALLRQMMLKYLGVDADDPRPVDAAPTPGEARAYGCAFRMEPRSW